VAEASETISRELVEAVATLRDASEQSGCYADTLDVAASTLEGGLDAARFRALVAKLASVTRDIAQKNHALSEQMAASSRQVEALQATLQSVKVQALTDGLTGLANRKYFDETLRRRVTESDAGAGELCLLMCDIDQFKAFNDSWGHLVGDQVIRFIAGALNVHAGGDFLAARYGGDEFALVMPRTTREEARNVGAAILNAVRAKRLTRRSTGAAIGSITLSIGIAERKTGETPRSLIGRADACLYASKRGGRNRSTTDAELDQPFAA
jgi:diguanylate cyclase